MSLNQFIPQVWSSRLLDNLHKAQVYPQIANTDYEGEISGAGDTVKINSIGAVTVFDYTKNTDHPAAETLTDAQRSLLIDQSKGFNFQIDDVDKAQQKPKVMDAAMMEAAYALADVTDQFIAAKYVDADAGNLIGSTGSPTSITTAALAYNTLVDLGTLLDDANVPTDNRSVVVPNWYEALLRKAGSDFVSFGTDPSQARLRGEPVGEAAGFLLYKSNNVPQTAGTKYRVIASHKSAISFADQISDVEAYRPERRFADAVKGLHVYGAKVVRPTAMAVLTCNKT